MRQSDVNEWINDEVVSFYNTTSLVDLSSPDEHVGVVNRRNDDVPTYPFVGIQKISGTPDSAGLGNSELFVDEKTHDVNGILTSITYRRDVTYRLNLIPVTDGKPLFRDNLVDDITDTFSLIARQNAYPSDVNSLMVDEATPQGRSDDFVYADGVAMEIKYSRYITDDDPTAAETVNLDIDVTDDDPDVDDDTDADAFDETL